MGKLYAQELHLSEAVFKKEVKGRWEFIEQIPAGFPPARMTISL